MLPQNQRETFLKVAWSYIGRWYKWGGDDPSGFDCSGLVIECAQSVGLLPRGSDYCAADLWTRWKHRSVLAENATPGDVVFFGRGGVVSHVEIVALSQPLLSIGASGGGSQTLTEADAIEQNAFIKVRPVRGRGVTQEVIGIVDLHTPEA